MRHGRTSAPQLLRYALFLQLTLILFLLIASGAARAGTFNAFGPQQYPRGPGGPITVSSSFSILNPNTQYTLHVQNSGVSSAVISVNGAQVLGPSDFNPNVTTIDRPVSLQLNNEIDVQLRSAPGSSLTITIIGVDNDPPVITASAAPAADSFGWNNTNVVVTVTCFDKTSGVASCPAPVTVSTEGANQVVSGTATDRAGNTASTSITINLDKTPPTITPAAVPAANTFGWNNSAVTVSFSCADALSGIANCSSPVTLANEGANQIVNGAAVDKAGNTASATTTINIDKTPPLISAAATPAPNAAGWNNSDVTVSFQCSDALSGVATCSSPQPVINEGANQIISGTATDIAGNSATATATINLDKTPPVISISSPGNNSVSSTSTLVITGTATDALSGVAGTTCNGVAAGFQGTSFTCSVNLGPGANTISISATDVAGNTSSQSLTVSLGPAITDFNPKSASVGALISVSGSGFTSGSGVPQVVLTSQNGGTIAAPVAGFTATTINFVVPDGAASGLLTLTVGTQTVTSTATLNIVPSTGFSLTVGPSTASLIQGQKVNFAVTLSSDNGFNQLAALNVTGVPSGVASQFFPPQITAGQTSLLTLSAPATQAVGPATLKITASATVNGIAVSQSATASLNVQPVATSFMGRAGVDDALQTPLAGVKVTLLGQDGMGGKNTCSGETQSDEAGNFSFTNLPDSCTGEQLIRYDGINATTAKDRSAGTPVQYAGVDLLYTIVTHQVTTPPTVIRLPRIDDKETAFVKQNDSVDQTFTFKTIPNLTVTVYAGTTFSLADGSHPDPFPLIAVDVPVDRLPDEMPNSGNTINAFIVAFQPANAVASQPVAVSFPNTLNTAPGINMELDTLNPTIGMMVKYGTGTVSNDGTQIVPDFDPAHPNHRFGLVHFDWHGPTAQPPPQSNPSPGSCGGNPAGSNGPGGGGCGCKCALGKPVDLFSGIETINETDISISGSRGTISIERTYRSLTNNPGPFGIGTNHNYGYQLNIFPFQQGQGVITLIMPDGNQFPFNRQSDGTFVNSNIPTLRGAVLSTPSGGQFNLRWKDGTVYQFQAVARLAVLTAIVDSNGNTISLAQDFSNPGRITQVTDPVGRSLNLSYDSSNRITSISDPIGRTVQYTYNSQGTLASVTNPAGGITQYGYDGQNRLITVIDPRGIVQARNTLDANGRVIQQVRPDGGTLTFSYAPLNPDAPNSPIMFTRVSDNLGVSASYRFNPQGFMTDVVATSGQMRSIQTASGTNQVLSATEANSTQSSTYDPNGNVLTSTDALGNTTTLTYDPVFNKVTSATDPLGNTARFAYDSHGNLLTRTDANGHTTSFMYNSFGQVTQITDPLGQKTTLDYDNFGNLISSTDPLGSTTAVVYDAVSRPVQITDALGRKDEIVYDSLNRVAKQTNAQGNVTHLAYDPNSNLVAVTDANGNTTSFTYDSMNRLLTRTDPLGNADTRSYDSDGNLIQFVDRRGQTSRFIYDNLNRLVEADYQDSTITRSYDALGRLLHVNDTASGEFDFVYDATGRLLRTTNAVGRVQYAYDAAGRTVSRQVVGQPPLLYSYDSVGNLLSSALPQASASFTYDGRDQLSFIIRANGASSQYQYDPAGRLLSLVHSSPAGTLNAQTYSYDAAGSRTSRTTTVAQPLTTPAFNQSAFDAANRLLRRGTLAFSYDANGNLTAQSDLNATTTYTWDSRNRLIAFSGPNTQAIFQYDFAGNLISQSVNGHLRTYLLDDLSNVATLNDNGDQEQVVSGRSVDQHLAVIHSSGQVEYALTDAINSTVVTTDQSGRPIESFFYEPFGQVSAVSSFPFEFTGRTAVTPNLYYYRARYYNSDIGRFISEDPIGFGSGDTNLYAYVENSPINLFDPGGNSAAVALPLTLYPGQTVAEGIGGIACFGSGVCETIVALGGVAATGALLYYYFQATQSDQKCQNRGKCKPCIPPVGTRAYREDIRPTSRPHRGVPAPHWHLYEMMQNPKNCQCFWHPIPDNQGGFGASPPPPGTVPITPAGGGGPA